MDPRQLETLRAVADHGGVTAAARALHVTPSAVSQQLAALQRRAGVALVERVGRGVRLTPVGRELADRALDVAVALARAEAACDAYLERPTGHVRVAAFQSAAALLFPGLLARLAAERAEGPDAPEGGHDGGPEGGLTVELADEDVAQSAFPALTAEHDVVVAHRPDGPAGPAPWGPGVVVVPLLREPLDVALPPGHPLAGRAAVTPADLADERWVAVREGFPVAAVLDAVAHAAGRPPRVAHRINDFRVVEGLVAAGHGVSLLPRFTTDDRGGARFSMVPLAGVRAARQVDALLRPDRAERRVVRRVLDALRAEAALRAAG